MNITVQHAGYDIGDVVTGGVWRKWPDAELEKVRAWRAQQPPVTYREIGMRLDPPRSALAVKMKLIYEAHAEASGHQRGAGRRKAA